MSEWITATGETQTNTQSNLLPEDAQRGPIIETSMHAEVIFREGEGFYVEHVGQEYQADQGVNTNDGILASARTEGGGLIHGRNVIASDQVILPGGMPTSAGVAADLGFLVRNPDGTFSEGTSSAEHGSDNSNDATNNEASEFHIGDEGEVAMDTIVEKVEPGAAIAALNEVLANGQVSDGTLQRMAASAGMEPHQIAEMVNTAHAGFHEAATDHMANLGVTDEEAFDAFLNENPHAFGKLAEGARALVMGQGTEGLDTVASQFMEQADRYMTEDVIVALDTAGFEHRPDGKGGLIVITNDGMQVPFQVAVRQKIVRFS
ncbi:hypothetical protein K3X13_10010 [Aliiroseovarius crassostreae]|uniref:hypothetical protein n=1 Tax=Aliiroseovarius crassostreae TaxID=154981 RepID=UPI002206E17B|nr:hypothetical protein [Aliiroseovarius crassostreae]UWP91404.1 hypothetical protein K3X13_10010 [Aliiroseovarius crassostreae]